ncbi:hypothetical protein ACLKA7_001390 [Drosophila subpalustris]
MFQRLVALEPAALQAVVEELHSQNVIMALQALNGAATISQGGLFDCCRFKVTVDFFTDIEGGTLVWNAWMMLVLVTAVDPCIWIP